ncbi:hypothetical protein OGCDGJMD_00256 [Cyanobium usitatum str. Tous]|nr:hypothetical protein OGCDGJMD_00256 [Cyanobium usitatum str. Tous]
MSTAHRNARRRRSHLLAAAGSSFGHVQRNLLNGEGSRHDPVPCAWQPDSAEPLQSGQPVWRDPSTRLSSDTLTEQKDLDRGHQQDQREIKQLKQELRRKEEALAEAAALLLAAKKIQAYWGEDEGY